jgi:hypothetical protein
VGQIAQSHPEYCGIPGGVKQPLPNISATVDPSYGHATLYIGQGGSATAVELPPGLVSEVSQICLLFDGRLVVFGDAGGVAVFIVDQAKASVVDWFLAYRPVVISPNRRWIAFVKFYPLHGVEGSDEIMLYDLSKTPARNRTVANEGDPGTIIFPPGHENFPGSNIDLPKDQRRLGITRLYWAPDSDAIMFDEGSASGPGIVLVTLDGHDTPSAFWHSLTLAEICGREVRTPNPHAWKLDRAEFGPDLADSRTIRLEVSPSADGCAPHVVQLHQEDFHSVQIEAHVRPKITRKSVKEH